MNLGGSRHCSFQALLPRENGLTISSVGLGILSITAYAFSVCAVGFLYDNRGLGSILTVLLAIGFLTAIAAVVLGHLGRRPPKCDLAKPGSARIGTVGLLMGYL